MTITNHLLDCPQVTSPNQDAMPLAPIILVWHYTASGDANIASFFQNASVKVSAHLVLERNGNVTQCVPFNRRAWHAGESKWNGVSGCNSFSIGIEICNWGLLIKRSNGKLFSHKGKEVSSGIQAKNKLGNNGWWETYPTAQKNALKDISKQICAAYPSIKQIVGHEDIAPSRKPDPGPALYDFMKEVNIEIFGEDYGSDAPPTDPLADDGFGGTGDSGGGSGGSACGFKYGISSDEAGYIDSEGNYNPTRGSEIGMSGREGDPESAEANDSGRVSVSCSSIPTNAPYSYKVGRYFTLGDYTVNAPATTNGRLNAKTAKGVAREKIVCNLLYLATNCVDPLMDWCKDNKYTVKISSGFRNKTGGSDHNFGSAVDLMFFKGGKRLNNADLSYICKIINERLKLPFTQMIEENQSIIHLACRPSGNSKTRLFYSNNYGKTIAGLGYRYKVSI